MAMITSTSAPSSRTAGLQAGQHDTRRDAASPAVTSASVSGLSRTYRSCMSVRSPAREALFAAATHDLKTPLTTLTLWMDMLQMLKPRLHTGGDAREKRGSSHRTLARATGTTRSWPSSSRGLVSSS